MWITFTSQLPTPLDSWASLLLRFVNGSAKDWLRILGLTDQEIDTFGWLIFGLLCYMLANWAVSRSTGKDWSWRQSLSWS